MSNINYSEIRPKLSKDVVLRYAEPDPPLIYNRKTHNLIIASSYKVLDILKLCNGENNIEDISRISHENFEDLYSLLKKLEKLEVVCLGP